MTFLTASVKGFDHFDELAHDIAETCVRALDAAAHEGAAVASGIASERSQTGKMAHMEVVDPEGDVDGYVSGFRSEAWYAWFQSAGTGGNRTRKVKASTLRHRSSSSGLARSERFGGNTGITPLHFFEEGRTAGRRKLIEEIDRQT